MVPRITTFCNVGIIIIEASGHNRTEAMSRDNDLPSAVDDAAEVMSKYKYESEHIESTAPVWKRILFISLGILFFIIGVVAIFLPLSPSIVFFAIMAFFLIKASPNMRYRFQKYPTLSNLISSIEKSRSMKWQDRFQYLWATSKTILRRKAKMENSKK